jgi:hypothetical protein
MIGWPIAAILCGDLAALDNIGPMSRWRESPVTNFLENFRLRLISLEQKTRHGRCGCQ